MARIFLFLVLALCLFPVLSAKEIAVGAQGVSPFLDAEVSTNVLKVTRRGAAPAGELCRIRNDYRSFRIVFR